jgi:hypothetical protein
MASAVVVVLVVLIAVERTALGWVWSPVGAAKTGRC